MAILVNFNINTWISIKNLLKEKKLQWFPELIKEDKVKNLYIIAKNSTFYKYRTIIFD